MSGEAVKKGGFVVALPKSGHVAPPGSLSADFAAEVAKKGKVVVVKTEMLDANSKSEIPGRSSSDQGKIVPHPQDLPLDN